MAIVAISDLTYGERSVSFSVLNANPPPVYDTLAFSVIADALTAAGVQTSAIKRFLTTSHTDAAGTVRAFANPNVSKQGVILSYNGQSPTSIYISGDNQFSIGGGGEYAVRICLASTIDA